MTIDDGRIRPARGRDGKLHGAFWRRKVGRVLTACHVEVMNIPSAAPGPYSLRWQVRFEVARTRPPAGSDDRFTLLGYGDTRRKAFDHVRRLIAIASDVAPRFHATLKKPRR